MNVLLIAVCTAIGLYSWRTQRQLQGALRENKLLTGAVEQIVQDNGDVNLPQAQVDSLKAKIENEKQFLIEACLGEIRYGALFVDSIIRPTALKIKTLQSLLDELN